MNIIRRLLWLSLLLAQISHAETNTLSKTKENLNQLESKIRLLQSNLNQAQDKQALLKKELAKTEKQINESLIELKKSQQKNNLKEAEIQKLQLQIETLNTQLHNMQTTLVKYVRSRYQMKEKQPITWLLKQDDIQSIDRVLTYYQYIIRSHKHLIDELKVTERTLTLKKETLTYELKELQAIQKQLQRDQNKLDHEKLYRTALINSLNQDISGKQHTLETYRVNRINLSRLLTTLAQQSVLQTRHPLTQMKRKLIKPVDVEPAHIQKINQGILFAAPEGTPAHAVSPGKVVFCDWLNGYGLLMIIDHGWGFMTLYANNLAVFKQKGDTVNQGERIASIGHSGALHQNGLYFEIRHRGKAVPPMEWLK
ncbi:MAG: peptidoglycan DD-metalloendopeptidase family protein [Legionellaceae bacterium]|nr:peptidoglycan DD-metalloendopeptidase family protein [Legionellaceae bacterium]